MSHALTEADTFTATVVVPDGVDSRNNAAGDVEALAQSLANRTNNLNLHAARKNVAQSFTQLQTFSAGLTASAPVNIPAIANDVTIGDDLTVTNDAAIGGDLAVTGNAAIPNVSGSVVVAGGLTAATLDSVGDLFAGDDVIATDEYLYATPPSRTRFLELFDTFGEGALSFGGGTFHIDFSAAAKTQLWPIRLPEGATLTAVQLVCAKAGGGTASFRVWRKQGYSWPGAMPNDLQRGSTDTETGSGDQMMEVTGLTQGITNNSIQCFAEFTSGDAGDSVYGLRVTFTDPGPRNH